MDDPVHLVDFWHVLTLRSSYNAMLVILGTTGLVPVGSWGLSPYSGSELSWLTPWARNIAWRRWCFHLSDLQRIGPEICHC